MDGHPPLEFRGRIPGRRYVRRSWVRPSPFWDTIVWDRPDSAVRFSDLLFLAEALESTAAVDNMTLRKLYARETDVGDV